MLVFLIMLSPPDLSRCCGSFRGCRRQAPSEPVRAKEPGFDRTPLFPERRCGARAMMTLQAVSYGCNAR
jgi:hypothetical protein